MAITTFTPPRTPSLDSKKTVTYRVKNAGFGDGYVQRSVDGINAAVVTWDLVWKTLSISDANTIEAFLTARAGFEAFYYTAPSDVQRKYICGSVSRVQSEASGDTITVTLSQVFDP